MEFEYDQAADEQRRVPLAAQTWPELKMDFLGKFSFEYAMGQLLAMSNVRMGNAL